MYLDLLNIICTTYKLHKFGTLIITGKAKAFKFLDKSVKGTAG